MLEVIPILDARDVDALLRFYVDKLGFEIDFRYPNDPSNYAGVRRGTVRLHMQWQHQEHFQRGTAGRLRIRIKVYDPDALFEEFASRGVFSSEVAVRDTEWGTREFGFRDPDGNGLIFFRDR